MGPLVWGAGDDRKKWAAECMTGAPKVMGSLVAVRLSYSFFVFLLVLVRFRESYLSSSGKRNGEDRNDAPLKDELVTSC